MEELEELDRKRPGKGGVRAPRVARAIHTPLAAREWARELANHPDERFRKYIETGLSQGFRIGFDHGRQTCKVAKKNMLSAYQNPSVVDDYLAKEVSLGRVCGPLEVSVCPGLQVSRFGTIPKAHQPGEFRLILDLSHPRGASVNDGVQKELCSLQYASVGEAVRKVLAMEEGSHLSKLDIKSAFRIVPVHPEDRNLLGMEWRGKRYIDMALPFGLRSAPKIFTAIGDALEWILRKAGIESIHYLDDFLVFGPAEMGVCLAQLEELKAIFGRLGVPIAVQKSEGPVRVITFLGILIDLVNKVLRLPDEKLQRLIIKIKEWGDKKACTKRELQSLIGHLSHACCVVRPGRTFLRRMIDLTSKVDEPHHHINLGVGFRSDLLWWACFLPSWNGTSMMTGMNKAEEAMGTVTSDASGSWGCGAFCSTGDWFQLQWPAGWEKIHITIKELVPVVLAIALWGQHWKGTTVKCLCDNGAVVAGLNSGRSRDKRVMHLLRAMFLFTAKHSLFIVGEHIPGVQNTAADALSRDKLPLFLQLTPEAKAAPTPIPHELKEALVLSQPDWTEPTWRRLLQSTLGRV